MFLGVAMVFLGVVGTVLGVAMVFFGVAIGAYIDAPVSKPVSKPAVPKPTGLRGVRTCLVVRAGIAPDRDT